MGARPGRACPICSNAELLPVVTALLEAGTTHGEIAERTSFTKDQVARHKRHSRPSAPADEPGDELAVSNARLGRWLERSEAAWVSASALGDTKAAIDALRSGVRAELEHHRRLEKTADQTSVDAKDDASATIAALDKMVAKVQRERYAHCHCCRTSWGDPTRVRRFTEWLVAQGQFDEFQKWLVEIVHCANERKTTDEVRSNSGAPN
jgi:hypothetical protein